MKFTLIAVACSHSWSNSILASVDWCGSAWIPSVLPVSIVSTAESPIIFISSCVAFFLSFLPFCFLFFFGTHTYTVASSCHRLWLAPAVFMQSRRPLWPMILSGLDSLLSPWWRMAEALPCLALNWFWGWSTHLGHIIHIRSPSSSVLIQPPRADRFILDFCFTFWKFELNMALSGSGFKRFQKYAHLLHPLAKLLWRRSGGHSKYWGSVWNVCRADLLIATLCASDWICPWVHFVGFFMRLQFAGKKTEMVGSHQSCCCHQSVAKLNGSGRTLTRNNYSGCTVLEHNRLIKKKKKDLVPTWSIFPSFIIQGCCFSLWTLLLLHGEVVPHPSIWT